MFQVGWDTKPEDDHSAKLLRSTVISLLDNFACDDEVVLQEVKRRFEGHFTEPSLLPSEYKVRTCVYCSEYSCSDDVICENTEGLFSMKYTQDFEISRDYTLTRKCTSATHFNLL